MSVLLAALLLACKGEPTPEPAPYSDCDPLDLGLCALPWPNDFFTTEDTSTVTGRRLSLGPTTLPGNVDDIQLSPTAWNERDGFSTIGTLLFYVQDVDPTLLPGHLDLDASLAEDAPILLLNAETGERVPYFAEVDATPELDHERMILVHPVEPMEHATRYVVGVRGLRLVDGSAPEVSEAFAQLRDGLPTDTWDVEGRRQHFDDAIFPVLERAGVTRSELQLAWDFTTISRESSLGRVEWMRDDAAARVGEDGPPYTITSIEDHDCAAGEAIGRTIYGTFAAPLYTDIDGPGALLTRDADGMPYYNGEAEVEFMVRVPCSLIQDPKPGFILQYGHGLLGDKGEARTGYLSNMANEYGWVVIATDWIGMASEDRGPITLMLAQDPSGFAIIPERGQQGLVQTDLMLRLARGALSRDEALSFEGVSVVDPDRFGYYGNSQGGIIGGAYMGLSTQHTRGVLGVTGAPYNLLLNRSVDFDPFFLIFLAKFDDFREITFLITAFQTLWDPAEAGGWLRSINQEPGEGQQPKDILIQVAVGDAQVTTLGAHIQARAYGAQRVAPSYRPIWGVEEAEAPFSGSAIVEWFYSDGSEEPVDNTPPSADGDTHECPRREPAAQAQLRAFLEDGVIEQHCEGVCEGVREGFCD